MRLCFFISFSFNCFRPWVVVCGEGMGNLNFCCFQLLLSILNMHVIVRFAYLATGKGNQRSFSVGNCICPWIKDNKDSRTLLVAPCTSLKMLKVAPISLPLLEEEVSCLFSTCFKFVKPFLIAFFTAFLELKYFLTSIVSPVSTPCLLRKID